MQNNACHHFDEFLYGSLENPCHHNCNYMCVPQQEHVPGHLVYIYFFKCSCSDSIDKEGRLSSILKSVQRSFSSDSHCFAVSLLEGNLIFPPSEFLIQTAGGWHRRTRETFTAVRTPWATMIHPSETQKEQLLCSGIIFLLCRSDESSAETW